MRDNLTIAAAAPALTGEQYQILVAVYLEPATGLRIFEQVAVQTDNTVVLSPAALYTGLKQLLEAGWIKMLDEQEARKDLEGRKQYIATALGQAKVDEMAAWMQRELPRIRALQSQAAAAAVPPQQSRPKRPVTAARRGRRTDLRHPSSERQAC